MDAQQPSAHQGAQHIRSVIITKFRIVWGTSRGVCTLL
jgi:hypothetical protein